MRVSSLLVAASTAALVGPILAGPGFSTSDQVPQYRGTLRVDASGQQSSYSNSQFGMPGKSGSSNLIADATIYSNLTGASAVNAATSLLKSANPVFGDNVTAIDTGRLDEFACTIYNSSTGTGDIVDGTMNIVIYDNTIPYGGAGAISNPVLGSFGINFNFSTPLAPGFFDILDVSGIASAIPIDITATNLLITQQYVGGPNSTNTRIGFAGLTPVDIGSSGGEFYMGSSTLAAGYYVFGTGGVPAGNPGYFVYVPEPASLGMLALALPLVARRRKA